MPAHLLSVGAWSPGSPRILRHHLAAARALLGRVVLADEQNGEVAREEAHNPTGGTRLQPSHLLLLSPDANSQDGVRAKRRLHALDGVVLGPLAPAEVEEAMHARQFGVLGRCRAVGLEARGHVGLRAHDRGGPRVVLGQVVLGNAERLRFRGEQLGLAALASRLVRALPRRVDHRLGLLPLAVLSSDVSETE